MDGWMYGWMSAVWLIRTWQHKLTQLQTFISCTHVCTGRARIGKLKPEEYQGGCFSVSNLGMFGIDSFSAVINPPQAGILAIGAGVPVPRMSSTPAADGEQVVEFDTMMNVTLSCDRRVVDEGHAAEFMQCFRTYMENPMLLSVWSEWALARLLRCEVSIDLDWLIDWFIGWLIGRLIDLLIDWLIDLLVGWLIDWLIEIVGRRRRRRRRPSGD
jgi:hypothetical protein